jgi:ribonuclease-3
MKPGGAAALAALERRIGYRFTDRGLLTRALTHASAVVGRRAPSMDTYERLEFLGDRVLGLVVAEMLLEAFPAASEGEIAARFSGLVRNQTCVETALALDLGSAILLGGGEVQSGGREKSTILGDACEAVIGAIYLDGGLEAATRFVRDNWHGRMMEGRGPRRDAKTALQEWSQSVGHGTPTYEIIGKSGPDHEPRFAVEARIAERAPGRGEGGSRRDAEQAAAAAVLVREGVWKEAE